MMSCTADIMPVRKDPTLSDVLAAVPDLLQVHLLNAWPTVGAGIRVMRLVSKELAHMAPAAITSCTMLVGEWAHPSPEQVVKLMKKACLRELEVIISTCPGETMVTNLVVVK